MKLYTFYTPSHKELVHKYLLKSLRDEYDVQLKVAKQKCATGNYKSSGWTKTTADKVLCIIEAIKENWGKIFVYCDPDIQFFAQTQRDLQQRMKMKDIVLQKDHPAGTICTGFFACRGNGRSLKLFEECYGYIVKHKMMDDQDSFNRVLGVILKSGHLSGRDLRQNQRGENKYRVRWKYLPESYFTIGQTKSGQWSPGKDIELPKSIRIHHANWTVGVSNKKKMLEYVANKVKANFSDTCVIFVHIPKTAGTTFESVLKNSYPPQYSFFIDGRYPNQSISFFKGMPNTIRKSCNLVSGHLSYKTRSAVGKKHKCITFLRHPVERIVSHYEHVMRDKNHPYHEFCTKADGDIEAYVKAFPDELVNGQAKTLYNLGLQGEPSESDLLRVAKNNICEEFEFVGITELFDYSLFLLKEQGLLNDIRYVAQNIGSKGSSMCNYNKRILHSIAKINAVDMQIYEYAREMLRKQIEELSYIDRVKYTVFRVHMMFNNLFNKVELRVRGQS